MQNTNVVCKLRKALYCLKQSSRTWFGRFSQVIQKIRLLSIEWRSYSLFYKHSDKDKLTVFIIYVDDIIITGNYSTKRVKLEQELMREFAVKNLAG